MKKDNTKMVLIVSSVLSAILSFILIDFLDSLTNGDIGGVGIVIYRMIAAIVIGMSLGLVFGLFVNNKNSGSGFSSSP